MPFHTPGGGEIQLLAYQKHLPAYGIDVSLFDPWNPRFLDHDVVHFFSCMGGSVHFCRFVKQLGLPLVVSSSLWITHETKHLYPIDEIRSQLDLADKVVANSDIECDTLSEVLDIPRGKFSTVYNGVEDIFFQTVDPELFRKHFGIEGQFILNVGNIEPRKNQLRLVEAMKFLPDIKLVLIGYARDQEYLNSVLSKGGENVLYIGPLDHKSELLRSAYQSCVVFCLPSTLETPGLAALESAAVGGCLVITGEGSAREYFGSKAIYVDPKSSEDILAGLNKALRIPHEVKKSVFPIWKEFQWPSVVEKLADIYRAYIPYHLI